MTGTDFITQVKNIINDPQSGWTPAQYLEAVNYSIHYVAKRRIDKKDPEFCFTLSIINGSAVPDNFMGFAGNYPIEIKDTGLGRQFFHNYPTNISAKYFVDRPSITATTDTIPLKTCLIEAAKLAAAIYLKEQRGYNMAQEKARLEEMLA